MKTLPKREKFFSGHRTCAGCAVPIIVRTILGAIDDPVVVVSATGCLEVTTTIYPESSWGVPFMHSAFENAGATIAGIESVYKVLQNRHSLISEEKNLEGINLNEEELKEELKKKIGFSLKDRVRFLAFGGDGGTYDIGLQSLSGALERGHDFLYVCYDNGAYMNTGGQRSGATPQGAGTTTTPVGSESLGKEQKRKNLMEIIVAHNIPYVAQASVYDLADLKRKVQKAMTIRGAKFLNILSPCPTLWRFPLNTLFDVAKLAVDTRFWLIYEVENGRYKINYKPKEFLGVERFLETQKRFAHLFKETRGKRVIADIQRRIDLEWERLVAKES